MKKYRISGKKEKGLQAITINKMILHTDVQRQSHLSRPNALVETSPTFQSLT